MSSNSESAHNIPLSTILCVYARDIFRNQADFDYIAARSNFKLHLRQQFLWSSQQAIEKYLKAILLFNGHSAKCPDINKPKKEFGHHLDMLLRSVISIPNLNFSLKYQDQNFLDFLTSQGPNRYISSAAYSSFDALERLDSLVWHIRRYCQSFKPVTFNLFQSQSVTFQDFLDCALDQKFLMQPYSFKLAPGEDCALEKVLKRTHDDPARRALVWANLFFGAKKKQRVKYTVFSSIEIPPKERGWEGVDWNEVDKYVKP